MDAPSAICAAEGRSTRRDILSAAQERAARSHVACLLRQPVAAGFRLRRRGRARRCAGPRSVSGTRQQGRCAGCAAPQAPNGTSWMATSSAPRRTTHGSVLALASPGSCESTGKEKESKPRQGWERRRGGWRGRGRGRGAPAPAGCPPARGGPAAPAAAPAPRAAPAQDAAQLSVARPRSRCVHPRARCASAPRATRTAALSSRANSWQARPSRRSCSRRKSRSQRRSTGSSARATSPSRVAHPRSAPAAAMAAAQRAAACGRTIRTPYARPLLLTSALDAACSPSGRRAGRRRVRVRHAPPRRAVAARAPTQLRGQMSAPCGAPALPLWSDAAAFSAAFLQLPPAPPWAAASRSRWPPHWTSTRCRSGPRR